MRQFAELTVSLASDLIAREAALPSWMIQAREALLAYQADIALSPAAQTLAPEADQGPLASRRASAAFIERLASIVDWPQSPEEIKADLLTAASPVIDFAARSFFFEGRTEADTPVAHLWSSHARVASENGVALFEFDDGKSPFPIAGLDEPFKQSDWQAIAPASLRDQKERPAGPGAAMAQVMAMINRERELTDDSVAPSSPSVAISKNLASSLFSLPGAKALVLVDTALGELNPSLNLPARFAQIEPFAPPDVIDPSSTGRELLEETPAPLLTAPQSEGEKRLQALQAPLRALSSAALLQAKERAKAGFHSFLKSHCPQLLQASEMARVMWNSELSMAGALSASAWAPIAARLLEEDPRGARLAFALAPALNLSPSMDMLSQTKAALKELGFGDAPWRELARMPEESFEPLLGSFRAVAAKLVADGQDPFNKPPAPPLSEDEHKSHFMSIDFDAMLASPSAGVLQTSTEGKLRNLARRCALSFEVARQAGVPFELSSAFCMDTQPLRSPAWKAMEQSKKPDLPGATEQAMDLFHFYRDHSASYQLASFCLVERGAEINKERAPARWLMEQAEGEAAGVKSAKILALALKEAISRPFKDVEREMSDLVDWFNRSEPGLWQTLPDKMTWASLRRRETAWHEELAAAKDACFKAPWAPILEQPVACGELFAVELKTGQELFEEGKRMKHCVSSYAQDCREGVCRIYSIRNAAGDSLATLEARLACDPANPTAAPVAEGRQLRGVCNSAVPNDSPEGLAAHAAIEALNRAACRAFERASATPEQAPTFTDFHAALAARRGALASAQSQPVPLVP